MVTSKVCEICGKEYTPRWAVRSKTCASEECLFLRKRKYSIERYRADPKKSLEEATKNRNKNPFLYIFTSRRYQALKHGTEFSLNKEDIVVPSVCPVFGTEFTRQTPYAMSLDRIDPNKGYIKGNVQILSRKANTMKSNASKEELLKFADWIYRTYGS